MSASYPSNMQAAVHMSKTNKRTSKLSMSAAFGANGAPLGKSNWRNTNSDEFTITHNTEVEKPWGFPRMTRIEMAEAVADDFVPDM